MVDIYVFWQSLKCTWVRRLLSTKAFWPEILKTELTQHDSSIQKLLSYGPSYLLNISKKLKNKFWQNVLFSLANMARESSFSNPENFYLFSIFNNPLFKSARRTLTRNDFGNPEHQIRLVADL